MKLKLLLIGVLLSLGGCATMRVEPTVVRTYQSKDGDVLVLLDAPCASVKGALEHLIPDLRPELKAAHILWKGKTHDACWVKQEDGSTLVVDDTGDAGTVEGGAFSPQEGTGV